MRSRFVLVCFAAWLLACGISHAQPAGRIRGMPPALTTTELRRADTAANTALVLFKDKLVDDKNYERMGFHTPAEVRLATLGKPTHDSYVRLDELARFQAGTNAMSLLNGSRELMYPVLVGTEVRSSISVALVGNAWRATSLGAPNRAKAIFDIRDRKSSELSRPLAAFFVVRVPSLRVTFLAHGSGGGLELTPILTDARFGFAAGQSLPANQAFAAMVQAAVDHDGSPN